MKKLTPMLQQYFTIKSQNQDCILLFRLGDFYEMFGQDAEIASQILHIALTARNKGTENEIAMCGFPHFSAEQYMKKLIKAGYKVAICDQMSDPNLPGIVERAVTRIVTPGTLLSDLETGEEFEITHAGQEIEICRGGIGGKGNAELANSRNTTPMKAQDGRPGQTRILKLTLKLIADFGLIGLPNAGKSSLLNELTRATAKVANYPFTTLEPNLGVLGTHVLADIPGLIEGAAGGKGLGIKFLKHIEKTTILLHCVAADSEDILADYKTVRQELANYNPELLEKPEIILLTKSDLIDSKDLAKKQKTLAKFGQVLTVSIHDWDSLQELINHLQR